MSKLALLLPVVALVACQKAIVEQAYGDREKFNFYSESLEEPASYLCEPGKDYPATKARAEAAHAFFEKNLEHHSTRLVEGVMDKPDASQSDFIAMATQMQRVGRKIGAELEAKYQCVMVEN